MIGPKISEIIKSKSSTEPNYFVHFAMRYPIKVKKNTPLEGKSNPGNYIQIYAQILYGYGYFARYALEFDLNPLACEIEDLESALFEYRNVINFPRGKMNTNLATFVTMELDEKIKENLYCLISRRSGNQAVIDLESFTKIYSQLVSENISQK